MYARLHGTKEVKCLCTTYLLYVSWGIHRTHREIEMKVESYREGERVQT